MRAEGGIGGGAGGIEVAVHSLQEFAEEPQLLGRKAREHFLVGGLEYRAALGLCGKLSGRDTDKLKEAGLSSECYDGVPLVSEARMAVICKKLYADFLKEDCFISKELLSNYAAGDFHRMYVVEIEKVLVKN